MRYLLIPAQKAVSKDCKKRYRSLMREKQSSPFCKAPLTQIVWTEVLLTLKNHDSFDSSSFFCSRTADGGGGTLHLLTCFCGLLKRRLVSIISVAIPRKIHQPETTVRISDCTTCINPWVPVTAAVFKSLRNVSSS